MAVIPKGTRPEPPVFTNLEDEREYRKIRLAAAFRVFAKFGYDEGVMGHISVRDPIKTDHYWTNPLALSFKLIKASDLVLQNYNGEIVHGHGHVHGGALQLHLPLQKLRPDIIAIAHTHSIYGKTWSSLNRLIDPITSESAVFYKAHDVFDSYKHGEGEALANAVGDHKALLLKNHGLVTFGKTVDEAAYWFISLERACQAQLLAEAVGTPEQIPQERAEKISNLFTPAMGWLNFQPYYDSIIQEQPDLAL
ncbi:class II aldolase/adducin family protein [Paenibacillus sp. GCM10012307]|uniref:Class II aldolase/adducin family protein n=1 Tax=Paenibacillus roseus TaxID=2798579 RepID=A0A934MP21_9BACL|nr:class II aldolase/adducin family protein [Paenibacillus roseus]MBJ6361601.1 class II aldolase/adducin family protein [Paenibacillus roseus]